MITYFLLMQSSQWNYIGKLLNFKGLLHSLTKSNVFMMNYHSYILFKILYLWFRLPIYNRDWPEVSNYFFSFFLILAGYVYDLCIFSLKVSKNSPLKKIDLLIGVYLIRYSFFSMGIGLYKISILLYKISIWIVCMYSFLKNVFLNEWDT